MREDYFIDLSLYGNTAQEITQIRNKVTEMIHKVKGTQLNKYYKINDTFK